MAVKLPPPELLLDIFETSAMLLSDSRPAQQRWLWQASSTSAELADLVSYIALRHVHVFRASQVRFLAAKLDAQPHIACHIRKLEVVLDHVQDCTRELVDLIARCSALRELVLHLRRAGNNNTFGDTTFAGCQHLDQLGLDDLLPALQTLESLESFVCHNCLPFDFFAAAASSWPRLHTLKLHGGIGSLPPFSSCHKGAAEQRPPLPAAVVDLLSNPPPFKLRAFEAGILPIHPTELEWLFSTSSDTLTSFSLCSAPAESYLPCGAWLDLFARVGRNLESVVFRTTQLPTPSTPSVPRYLDRVVVSCPRLKRLAVAATAPSLSPSAVVLSPAETFSSAESVESLSIAASYPVGVVPALIEALTNGRLKKLRCLEVILIVGKDDRDERSKVHLKEVCAKRGIQIGYVYRHPWTLA
jgi:hypothetical protein